MSVVLMTLGAGADATSASALGDEVPTSCSNLQNTITRVAAEEKQGEGYVIVLNGLCDATELKSSSGVRLPAGSNFSIEGKPGTTSGFEGAGVTGPLLGTENTTEAGAMTLSDLTFQHADLPEASALSIRASRLTLSDDSFLDNEEHGENAHALFVDVGGSHPDCPPAAGPAAITLTGSTFSNNKLVLGSGEGGGGAAWLEDACELSRNVLEDNTFEHNTLEATGTAEGVQVTGGGLQFVGGAARPVPVSQSGNVFDSNSILAPAPDLGNYGGGGEWIEDTTLMSIGDRFSRNVIAGTSSQSYERWSWGAGLGIDNLSLSCDETELPTSTLENAVVTGNAIGPGFEADLGGGGVWVGCVHLHVFDSTVTLNDAPYGAGIEGEPYDQLEVANSIVAGDSSGNETEGFNESGGSVTASFSDVCAIASSNAPLPGTGNICADPLLANDGDPTSLNVHETESSPTIDAGSNTLVPAGLTTDFYGNQRELAGHYYTPVCIPPATVWPTLDPLVVDLGASEFGPIAVPTTPIVCSVTPEPSPQPPVEPGTQPPVEPNPQSSVNLGTQASVEPGSQASATSSSPLFSFPSFAQRASGLLMLTLKGQAAGQLRVRGTFNIARSVVAFAKGRHRRVSKVETVTYGQSTLVVTTPENMTLQLKPTKQALQVLARRKRLQIRLAITFSPSGAMPSTHDETVTVVYRSPSSKHHG
ncbi:MAG TPA: hypothetical protein VIJ33_01705 [Solirubrobacteraceae bacterium]